MSDKTKSILGVAGSAVLLTGLATAPAATLAQSADAAEQPVAAAEQVRGMVSSVVKSAEVQGTFAFTQEAITPTDQVARALNDGAKYLCGSDFTGTEAASAEDWAIRVRGAVGHEYASTLGEMEGDGRYEVIMGCSCSGNPADGNATVNAEVTGITVESIIEAADVSREANTIVFTSADGYEVALPLTYVAQRASLIVFALNGEDLCDSIGGTNQLWLGSTSAKYFVRNVELITLEARDELPPIPGTAAAGDAYANVPNISIAMGGAA